ncbi:protein DBF4 homolog A-like [Uloborus diversus]|uniref:protein DBF4 homolog A-like n=1 Tax=Uloborus diversus TaxID=327109 RepID=UPI002409CA8E|nr:protein DBF4 homolog A-like [Uloborus diversus]
MNSATLKPLAKQSFFLDLKGYQLELKLAKDLKLLGGKQETFFSKDVSFVVSDRISANWNSFSSKNSWSNCARVSSHLFNESAWDFTDSPTNVPTLNQKFNFATYMSRGWSLVEKSWEKAEINHQSVKRGTADVLENCKLWNIKVYDVETVLSWVKKYKNLYRKIYAAENLQNVCCRPSLKEECSEEGAAL